MHEWIFVSINIMCMTMHAAHALLMKALGEPKRRRCAEMSMLMYAFFQQYDTVKHSVGNEADQSPSNSCTPKI